MTYRIFILILLIPSAIWSQTDSTKLAALNADLQKAYEFKRAAQIDSALFYFDRVGIQHRAYANYPEALSAFFEGYKIRDSISNGDRALSLMYMASVEGMNGNYERAGELFNDATKAAYRQQDTTRICQALANCGANKNDLKQYDSALYYLNQAEEISRSWGMPLAWKASLENNIGNSYSKMEIFDQALPYFQRAYALMREGGIRNQYALSEGNIGYTYQMLENYDSALYYFYKAIRNGKIGSEKYNLLRAYINIQALYDSLGKKDSVIHYMTLYNELYREINEEEKIAKISELQIQYNTQKMEKENAQQRIVIEEASNRQRLLIIALLGVLVAALLLYIIYKRRELKRDKAFSEINDLLKDQEIRSFHSVLEAQEKERKRIAEELHDKLGSTLSAAKLYFNNLENNAVNQENKVVNKGMELLDIAVQDVRMISHNMLSGVLSQFGLVPALNDLRETISGSGKVKMKVLTHGVNQRLDQKSELHVYRIIQELVSNALKHSNATEIIVQVTQHEHEMTVTVEDNGEGFDPGRQTDGMGMRNIMNRVGILNANINFDTGKGQGTIVTIDIPT